MKKLALLLSLLVLSCGTSVHQHEVSLQVEGLGDDPVEVSVFDRDMGYSEEWARRKVGLSSPGRPYVTDFSTVDTATVGSGGPKGVTVALSIPKLRNGGYWLARLEPLDDSERRVMAAFVPWNEYFPPEPAGKLRVRYSARKAPRGLKIQIFVEANESRP